MFLTTILKNKTYIKNNEVGTREPLLCLTFDDGNQSDVDVAYPYLKEKGLVSTFMLVTNWIENPNPIGGIHPREEGQWELYKQAVLDGFELGCHTHRHRGLTEISLAEVQQEMEDVNQVFIEQGLEPPKAHTFPKGLWNEDAVDVVLQYRDTVMRMGYGVVDYDKTSVNKYLKLPISEINSRDRVIANKNAVKNAIENGHIIISTQHRVSEDGFGGSVESLWKEWIDYVAESGIRTVTVSELHQILKDYKNID